VSQEESEAKWTLIDKKHTILFNHIYGAKDNYLNQIKGAPKDQEKINLNEEFLNNNEDYKEWLSKWNVRTSSSNSIVENIFKKIKNTKKGSKIKTINLSAKGIYVGEFDLDGKKFKTAIYSKKKKLTNLVKIQVDKLDKLADDNVKKKIKVEETYTKYFMISFYEDDEKEPSLIIQSEK
jgi:hypothetical protein